MYNLLMPLCNRLNVCQIAIQLRSISTSSQCYLIQSYRKKKGLPMNSNASGPLTDLPDYTFLSGKPVPLGMHQKRRMIKQIDIAKRIITLSKEIDFAIKRNDDVVQAAEDAKQQTLNNKLKPKGHLLLKTK